MSMQDKRAAAPEPTEIAGRYQVIKKLGAGAFGTVYKAKDKILGRMLAIKTIRLEGLAAAGASLDEMLDRFKREAQVSAQLKHHNIVTIYDIGDDDGMSYLAMEFIDGVGLEKMIAQGKLTLERAASIGAQVADALDFAHQHSVVHRDIKPANIMLESGDRVKVTDFGIAKVTDSAEHLTMTGSLLGTPSYMSPEQARGGSIDGRSDLFAVGCVLYEMMAGKKAFRGESITALIFKIITEEPQPIQELDPEIPDAMVKIIAKALAKAPEARYQSGRELADELLTLTRAGSMPTVRQVETPTVPGAALPSVTPTVQVAAPTIAAAATVAGAAPTRRMDPAPPPMPKPAPPAHPSAGSPPPPRPAASRPAAAIPAARKSGGGAGLIIGLGLVGLLGAIVVAGAGWYFLLRKPAAQVADVSPTPGPTTPTDVATPVPPPPTSPPVDTAPTPVPATPPPAVAATPTTAPSQRDPGPSRPPAAQLRERPPAQDPDPNLEPAGPKGRAATSFLDAEPEDAVDGRAAGEDLASKYSSSQGSNRGSTGSTTRFRPRDRSPRALAPVERPAVATIRHLINAQEAYHRKRSRYGSLSDMASAQSLFLDVPFQATSFRRGGYNFELTTEPDGFRVVAMPTSPNGRPFIGDDSGIIRVGTE